MNLILENLLDIIYKLHYPSLPEIMDYSKEFSYLYEDYRGISNKSYSYLYLYLRRLIRNKSITILNSANGYRIRYCVYHEGRQYEDYIEPIPNILEQNRKEIKLRIFSDDIVINIYNNIYDYKINDYSVFHSIKIQNKIYIMLDNVLLGILFKIKSKWNIRLPFRDFYNDTEFITILRFLKKNDKNIEIISIKGSRKIIGEIK
jgi:hypothetical protein